MHQDHTRPLCRCGCGVPAHRDSGFPRGHYACEGPEFQRYWARVGRTDGCWLWTGVLKEAGSYGRFLTDQDGWVRAHRYAWIVASGGPIPDGFDILHTCDVRACVRNDDEGTYEVNGVVRPRRGHLWVGTHQDNMNDMIAKGRANHPLTSLKPRRIAAPDRWGMRKLSDNDVRRIRALGATSLSSREIGVLFGVSHTPIRLILRGDAWTHVQGIDGDGAEALAAEVIKNRPRRLGAGAHQARGERAGLAKLTDGDVREIRRLLAQGRTHRALAAQFGISKGPITGIARGVLWKHVE